MFTFVSSLHCVTREDVILVGARYYVARQEALDVR